MFIRNRIGTFRAKFRYRRQFDNKLSFEYRHHTMVFLEVGRLDDPLDDPVNRSQNRSFLLHDGDIEEFLTLLDDIAFLDVDNPEIGLARAGDMILVTAFRNNRTTAATGSPLRERRSGLRL